MSAFKDVFRIVPPRTDGRHIDCAHFPPGHPEYEGEKSAITLSADDGSTPAGRAKARDIRRRLGPLLGNRADQLAIFDESKHPRVVDGRFGDKAGTMDDSAKDFIKTATAKGWSRKVIAAKAEKAGFDVEEMQAAIRDHRRNADEQRTAADVPSTDLPGHKWTANNLNAALSAGMEVPAEAWAENYELAIQHDKREIANKVLLEWQAGNPSPQEMWRDLVAEADKLGLKHNGSEVAYVSKGGSKYLHIYGPGSEWVEIRVSNHGAGPGAGISLTPLEHPDNLVAKLAHAKAAIHRLSALDKRE